ncbi:MAG: hypothetical protein J7M18_03005, partial [Candidatus Eremiobacteraeota bacterium]|nr:hypothetical protein [Candidatus Eremiobacteraeota bacterium]
IVIWVIISIVILVLFLFWLKNICKKKDVPLVTCYLRIFKKFSIIFLVTGWILTILSFWIMKVVIPWDTIQP